jgi:hypothetical protein
MTSQTSLIAFTSAVNFIQEGHTQQSLRMSVRTFAVNNPEDVLNQRTLWKLTAGC